MNTPSAQQIEILTQWDTPTVCNALELVMPERRGFGFTVEQAVCLAPDLKPVIGYARTVRCATRTPPQESPEELQSRRLAYYEYVAGPPHPTIAVIEDIDHDSGVGAFWGEVQTNIHKGLGCVGGVTSGAMRDLDDCAAEFQLLARRVVPSHIHNRVVDFGNQVEVLGMVVDHDDLIHADRHGAVVVPNEAVALLPDAVDLMIRKEAILLDAARQPDLDIEMLRKAFSQSANIT